MFLKSIEIENVRSISLYKNQFSKGINLIYGKNGVGKTTILEAIHTLSISKSFRSGNRKNMLKNETDFMSIVGKFSDNFIKKIAFRKNIEKQKIMLDDTLITKLSDLIGVFPSIVLSPEDIDIVSGGNQTRLTYINKILSTISKEYLINIAMYNKILKIRNNLLKNQKPYNEVIIWDEQLVPIGLKVWHERKLFFKEFLNEFKKTWKSSNLNSDIMLDYKTTSETDSIKFLDILSEGFEKDSLRGFTGFGPHKDKINFFVNNIDIKNQASQGEKKFFLILLKITEAKLVYTKTNKRPVLLLDDLFAKLDKSRGKTVLNLIEDGYQTFITTTDNTVDTYFNNFDKVNFMHLKKENTCFAA